MNPERAIIGMAVVFGVADRKDGDVWYPEEFAAQIASEMGVDMWYEHKDPREFDSPGVIGTWRAFHSVAAFEARPAGLLTIGELNHNPFAEDVLQRVQRSLREPWNDADRWGLSVTARGHRVRGAERRLTEVSLVQERYRRRTGVLASAPAFEHALVMEVGPAALDVWRLMTDTDPPKVVAMTRRTVRGRLRGIAGDGRLVYDEWQE